MYCSWQVIVVIFLEAANVYTPNKVFFIWVSHNRRPAPIPPLVCRHPHRQKGQWGGTFKRRKAQWWSSSKVQSDSAEAHLCLSPTVCLYLWLWLRAGQYTEIFRLSLIRTGKGGVGKGPQWPWGNTDPRVKKTGRKSHGPFILTGSKGTWREKGGSGLRSLSTLVFLRCSDARRPQTCLAPGQVTLQHQDHHRPSRACESKTTCSQTSLLTFSHWKRCSLQSIHALS